MMTFNEWAQLRELFDSPGQYQWVTKSASNWTAEFEINGKRYEASFDEKSPGQDEWVYGFWQTYPRPTMGITGSGDASQVFSVVVKIGQDFIKEKRPGTIVFNAMEGSRRRLYQSMMQRFAPSVGYVTSYDNNGNFTLTRNDEGTPSRQPPQAVRNTNPNFN